MSIVSTSVVIASPQTYRCCSSAFTPGATPDDVFTITGSATKTIKVVRMGLASTQTTAGLNVWFIRKRSTANSGGTSTTPTIVASDSSMPADTAVVRQYTADPTLGTLVGDVFIGKIDSPGITTTGTGILGGLVVDFVGTSGSPIVLRGTGEVLSWNFNNAALPAGLSVTAWIEWLEE